MEILDKEAVEAANKEKNIPDIRPGDVIQLRVEVPENSSSNRILEANKLSLSLSSKTRHGVHLFTPDGHSLH